MRAASAEADMTNHNEVRCSWLAAMGYWFSVSLLAWGLTRAQVTIV
jgi:hypothetical protein